MQATRTRSGASLLACPVPPGKARGLQAPSRARVWTSTCKVAQVPGRAQGTQLPSTPRIFTEEKIRHVKNFTKNNPDDVLPEYLAMHARRVRHKKWMELAYLKGYVAGKEHDLQLITEQYYSILVRKTVLRFLEGICDGASDSVAWDKYVAKRPALQKRLTELNVHVEEAGALLSDMYNTLLGRYDVPVDTKQMVGCKLYIGRPLTSDERKIIASLCEDANVPYELVP